MAEALKLKTRLENLTVWEMEKVKESRKGSKTYIYWMASWREDGKTRNVHLVSARWIDAEASQVEGKEEEGGGAENTGLVIEDLALQYSLRLARMSGSCVSNLGIGSA